MHKRYSSNAAMARCRFHRNVLLIIQAVFVVLLTGLSNTLGFSQETVATDSTEQAIKREAAVIEAKLLDRIEAIDSMRVVLHAQDPAARLAIQLESLLSSLGIRNVEVRYVDKVPEAVQVRFYHEVDGKAGQVMADVMSLVFDEVAARDFNNYQPSPSQGLIEVWLP
ncbi:MAG: hypothetical protein AB8B97_16800 [Granulosicoccus sp.]